MPKKRTTRAKPANIQKPKDEGKQLTKKEEKERIEQLELMLKEFDFKAKNYSKNIEKQKRTTLTLITQRYQQLMAGYDHDIGNMTVREFFEAGGTFEKVQESNQEQQPSVESRVGSRVAELQNLLGILPTRGLDKVIEEDNDDSSDKEDVRPVQAPANKKGKKQQKSTMRPPSTIKTKRGMGTPLNANSRLIYGQTPLITPKFDPNLPQTPDNIREQKPGERLMSIAGSPVMVDNRRTVGKSRQETIQVISELSQNLSPHRMESILNVLRE